MASIVAGDFVPPSVYASLPAGETLAHTVAALSVLDTHRRRACLVEGVADVPATSLGERAAHVSSLRAFSERCALSPTDHVDAGRTTDTPPVATVRSIVARFA